MLEEKQEGIKEKIFREIVKIIPFDGLSERALEKASVKAGFDKNVGAVIFSGGIEEVIEFIISKMDDQMLADLKHLDLKQMRVKDKVIAAIKARLIGKLTEDEDIRTKKLIISKLLSYFQMPFNSWLGAKLLWKTADLIWSEVLQDKSQDFNYYTKRAMLAGIYSSTMLYWLQDDSPNNVETIAYLERRIDNVLELGSRPLKTQV